MLGKLPCIANVYILNYNTLALTHTLCNIARTRTYILYARVTFFYRLMEAQLENLEKAIRIQTW